MFDFGDELTIESYRIPWLIWIQIFIMFLLIILLYCFSISNLDLRENCSFASSSPAFSISQSHDSSLDKPLFKHNNSTVVTTSCLQSTQVGENQSIKGEIATSSSRRIMRGEDMIESESSSSKDSTQICYHPCYYIRLAKLAFLKCLGLDSTSENSSSSSVERRKRS